MKTIMTTLALILALGLGVALAEDLPAAAQRIWAPAGDEIGNQKHLTVTGVRNDDHGDEARAAQDEGIKGDWLGRGLFHVYKQRDNGHHLSLRGLLGNTEGGGVAGDAAFTSRRPGRCGLRIAYHAHDLYYDRDSELRNPNFPVPNPPELAFTPHLDWRRGTVDYRYHFSSAFDVYLGVDDMRREGRKSSRLGASPPNVQTLDTKAAAVWLGGVCKLGALGADLKLSYRGSDDDRAYETGHVHADERDRYSANLDVSYDLNPRTRLVAAGRLSRLEHTGTETGVTNAGDSEGDTDNAAYQLGAIARLGAATTVRVSARFDSRSTEAATLDGDDVLFAADREQDRQQYSLVVGNRSLPRTSIQLRYRYSTGDETEMQAQGARPNDLSANALTLDQESTRQDLGLRIRTRLGKRAKLRLDLRHTNLDVTQDPTWDASTTTPWFGVLGDHERARTSWRAGLQTRVGRKLPLELGLRGFDQTFKRTEGQAVETTASQVKLFANANWLASTRLTVFTMASYGQEKYELGGTEPTPGYEAFNVDATTLRLGPGVTVLASDKLQVDGWYEGVFFKDEGDESDRLNAIEADRDRLALRARYRATERLAVTLGYQRNEFDENRWDDYIQHLWTASAHMSF